MRETKRDLKNWEKRGKISAVIWVFLLIGLLLGNTASSYLSCKNPGFKYFKNYSYKEFDHQPQNWGFIQANNGLIYAANNGGVLEFDGVSWRVIYVPNLTVRSIAISENGTIYIGGINEIGYLAPDLKGSLKYKTLLDHLDGKNKNFSCVWRTHATKQGIFFRTSKFLFLWNSGKIKSWSARGSFRASFAINGKLFIQEEGKGLMRVVDDSLKLIPGGEIFAPAENEYRVFLMAPCNTGQNQGKLLIGTRLKGFFLYDGKTTEPFPTEVDELLIKNRATHGIGLSSGDFALGMLRGGLVVIDNHGRIKYTFDKSSGLQDENVKYIFEDMGKNLWLALNKGISRLEYGSPFFFYDERSALPGFVMAVCRHLGTLYVGTTRGLFVLPFHSKNFRSAAGINSDCRSLLPDGPYLLAATMDGVFQVNPEKNMKWQILKGKVFTLMPSAIYPERTWCGTDSGLAALIKKKNRIETHRFKNIHQGISSMVENKNGYLLLVTLAGSVLKVNTGDTGCECIPVPFDESAGIDRAVVYYVSNAAGHAIFATEKGIFRFDEKKTVLIPDPTFGDIFTGGRNARPVFRITADKNRDIWFNSESRNYRAIPGNQGQFKIYYRPFLRLPPVQTNTIYPDPDGSSVWFGGYDGLVQYDKTVKKDYLQGFRTLVRKVIINGELVFDGYDHETVIGLQRPSPVIEYKDSKNIHFEFASAFFEAETAARYRYLLEKHDDNWSAWTSNCNKDFTTLGAGTYTFRVQARNIYDNISQEGSFRFRILPPWHQTWWAYILYVLIAFLVIYLIVKWRSRKLVKEKQKLEQIVHERTGEVEEKNRQLEKYTITLREQSEKLKEMDQVKSRFFANISHEFRTPLTLIMGPLEQILADGEEDKHKETHQVMLRNSQRLLALINQLLDLSRFDSGKMKLRAVRQNLVPFLKGILENFRMLARQNQIELGFSSKEQEIILYFDPPRLEEAMYNLLINAFKFTPPGGKITVSVTIDNRYTGKKENSPPGLVKISVRDTGIGIGKEQLDHIFDRFYQAGIQEGNGNKGTGIGLALTREIIRLHRGNIDVHSQEGGKNSGTEFVIRLPLGDGHIKPGEIISASPAAEDFKKSVDLNGLCHEPAETGEQENPPPGDRNGKQGKQRKNVILVVEDNAEVRRYIRGPLKTLYTVVEAADGKEGIVKAKKMIPDLIVSDIMMPEVDGYELCRKLKKDIATSHIPIVLLTAKGSEESIIEGLETGADDYITKPFNSKMLLIRIKNLIELRRQMQLKIQRKKMLLPTEIKVSSVDEKFLKEFRGIIEKNFTDPDFNVDKLAKKLYMARATLFKKVHALLGETPNQIILFTRLERGAQLLRDNYGNVTEVAMAVGFSSSTYFATCFKEKFHQSPLSYQDSASGGQGGAF
ncbi:MAG: response regulator [Candidatus Aminicenantes bacterium]|jgi:signal transduction histidine kinase/DNA-binding response OmpR family regulator